MRLSEFGRLCKWSPPATRQRRSRGTLGVEPLKIGRRWYVRRSDAERLLFGPDNRRHQ